MLFRGDWVGFFYLLGALVFGALLEWERRAGKRLRERKQERTDELEQGRAFSCPSECRGEDPARKERRP